MKNKLWLRGEGISPERLWLPSAGTICSSWAAWAVPSVSTWCGAGSRLVHPLGFLIQEKQSCLANKGVSSPHVWRWESKKHCEENQEFRESERMTFCPGPTGPIKPNRGQQQPHEGNEVTKEGDWAEIKNCFGATEIAPGWRQNKAARLNWWEDSVLLPKALTSSLLAQ